MVLTTDHAADTNNMNNNCDICGGPGPCTCGPALRRKRGDDKGDLIKALDRSNVMLRVFLGCVTTGLIPKKGSPCHEMIMEIIGGNDRLLKTQPHQENEQTETTETNVQTAAQAEKTKE